MARREGSIKQRAKGGYQLRYYGPPDSTGMRKQVNETIKGTLKDANAVLRGRLTAIENGGYVASDKETVAQFMDRWMDTYAATNTTIRTQEGYKGNINRYINPSVGRIPIQSLTGRHIQAIYSKMMAKGLSARTTLHVHRVLRKALADAVKWGTLTRNVADAATPPRPENRQINMWDAETTDRFLATAESSRFCDLYYLAVQTGMRRSELAGLKWSNVDLVNGALSVVNTLQRIPGRGLVDGQPKTNRSRRLISLTPDSVALLHGVRGNQIERSWDYGELWQNTGYVFTQEDGSPIDPESVTRDFCAIVRKSGLPHLTFHGLRHCHATLALTAGVNPKTVADRLGHSSVATTMDVYSHVLPSVQAEAAQAVQDLLNVARLNRSGTG
jgi:integrase